LSTNLTVFTQRGNDSFDYMRHGFGTVSFFYVNQPFIGVALYKRYIVRAAELLKVIAQLRNSNFFGTYR